MNSLRFRLLQQGVEIVDDIEDAQVIIINTCTVTSSTESKTKRLIKAVAGQNPSAKILLTGCLAQQKPSELKDLDSVFWVVGNTEKDQIPSILEKNGGVFQHPFSREIPNLSIKTNEIPSVKDHAGFRTRFPLKIQEGCNYRCSYCIVPSVRGPSRSAEFSNVLSAFDSALKAGFKEIVLTGTHIGQFAKEQSASLLELLKEIVSFDGDFRVRLSSLDPRDLSDEILQLVGNNSKICDHLHISVQSFPKMYSGNGSSIQRCRAVGEQAFCFSKVISFGRAGSRFYCGFSRRNRQRFRIDYGTGFNGWLFLCSYFPFFCSSGHFCDLFARTDIRFR